MPKIFYDDGTVREVDHINPYLLPGPDILVESRTEPLCRVPKMIYGSMPIDGGNLILSETERDELLKKCPQAEKYVRRFMGAEEFIHNKKRFCLWLVDCPPNEIKKMKPVYERVKKVQEYRLKSKRLATQKLAETPHLFGFISHPTSNYILIPRVSSERRDYIPMDFVSPEIICSDANQMIPDAQYTQFGVLTSKVHMIWTRLVCGRLTSRIRYSAKIVYNNFVWMQMTIDQFIQLLDSAKKILSVRKNYPDASLADLYDPVTMPKDLRDAHRAVDKVVMEIYGFSDKMTEEEIAIELLEHYYLASENLKAIQRKNFDDEEFDEEYFDDAE